VSSREKFIYQFGGETVEGNGSMHDLLGGKGAGLAEMMLLGVPVPPGFTITTDVCRRWLTTGEYPEGLQRQIENAMRQLELSAGLGLGNAATPLLLSVRSGAPISMPGMMDTILNIGLNDETVQGLAKHSGSPRFAYDSYRRLIQMFSTVVLRVPKHRFDEALEAVRRAEQAESDSQITESGIRQVVTEFKQAVVDETGLAFPQDPHEQLRLAIEAVFQSWSSDRAQCYRRLNGISEDLGTAVTVQAMVFGNRGENSGTGVGFTRNPSTGEPELYGEFLPNAQGEDIVAGTRTPLPLAQLAAVLPDVFDELVRITQRLEVHFLDVQDFEFTMECGKLYLLQTRSAKRTAAAAVRTAVDMASEGLISQREALLRVRPSSLTEILAPQLDDSKHTETALTTGLAASPGAAVGRIALSADEAVGMAGNGEAVILVREETTAEDIHGMAVSVGFLTARGGATSHAAVVARGMGKCCITGASAIAVDIGSNTVRIGGSTFRQGDWLSIDGTTGSIFAGKLPVRAASRDPFYLDTLLDWASDASACQVWANADTPEDAAKARALKACGIGLCRTEHMFFSPQRLANMRSMILATNTEERVRALDALLPMQQQDFEQLFRSMSPLPVTIRLLDPPLHEFLPPSQDLDREIEQARREEDWDLMMRLEATRHRIDALHETNPMMGHRGCRLSVTYPEILRMQVRAVLQAALKTEEEGFAPAPAIMVPLIATEQEMRVLAELIHETAASVFREIGHDIPYTVGAMIELPRAAVCAGSIARHIDFISFGTNDLTQMTFGFSRDDARSFLGDYLSQGILTADPFVTIDRQGVGSLIEAAIGSARNANPGIKIGVCGEHGGDPDSIDFFNSLEVDYVSCSPARLPVAQLAAAHAQLSRSVAASAETSVEAEFDSDSAAVLN
jgi:pyruvate,orthophosphate dikinase